MRKYGESMDNNQIMEIVKKQLAIDYNCSPDDFLSNDIIFTQAIKLPGRRALPFQTPRCEIISMGNGVIVNASKDVMPFVKKRLNGKSKYEVINAPFIYGLCHYYLPDVEKIRETNIDKNYTFKIIEQKEIPDYYKYPNFNNALHYSESQSPEILGIAVFDGDTLAGIACATSDSEKMCQIGVDVLPEYRHQGIASASVSKLTSELLNRGRIPYYFTDNSNLPSQKTAIASGYYPAWIHSYKSKLIGNAFAFLNYLKY